MLLGNFKINLIWKRRDRRHTEANPGVGRGWLMSWRPRGPRRKPFRTAKGARKTGKSGPARASPGYSAMISLMALLKSASSTSPLWLTTSSPFRL